MPDFVERRRHQDDAGHIFAEHDWSASELGDPADWPASLRNAVDIMFDSPIPMWVAWGPSLTLIYNDGYRLMLRDKHPSAMGARLEDVWQEIWEVVAPMIGTTLTGGATFQERLPLVILRDGEDTQAYFSFFYTALRADNGSITGLICGVFENTESVLAGQNRDRDNADLTAALGVATDEIALRRVTEQQQKVVQRELAHRLKNGFAMMSAVVNQSAHYSDTVEELGSTIRSRLAALAAAQDILIAGGDSADLEAIIRKSLEPHVEESLIQYQIAGPRVSLTAQQGMGVALATHELATNAAKYGALSTPEGVLSISWKFQNDRIDLSWVEAGGPKVRPPEREGFGSRLLSRIVPAYFSGEGLAAYPPEGFTYRLSGTLTAN